MIINIWAGEISSPSSEGHEREWELELELERRRPRTEGEPTQLGNRSICQQRQRAAIQPDWGEEKQLLTAHRLLAPEQQVVSRCSVRRNQSTTTTTEMILAERTNAATRARVDRCRKMIIRATDGRAHDTNHHSSAHRRRSRLPEKLNSALAKCGLRLHRLLVRPEQRSSSGSEANQLGPERAAVSTTRRCAKDEDLIASPPSALVSSGPARRWP